MPIERMIITRVDPWPSFYEGPTVYIIKAWVENDPLGFRSLRTMSDLRAALCERAMKSQAVLTVTWREGRRIDELMDCQSDPSSVAGARVEG